MNPRCPLCDRRTEGPLRPHVLRVHGEEALPRAVLADKERGVPDPEIGERYGISFNVLQKILTEAYGVNVSQLRRPRPIRRWAPPSFREEVTTVWSFKQRGAWATHDGRYRGNWSPYIPRNLILKYSRPGDVVLDYFVGGGTTAVEAKLLGRRCIARDINPAAVQMTLENIRFSPPRSLAGKTVYEPEVRVGDARDLSDIPSASVDLICAHPPYAGIIPYSLKIPGDLSGLDVPDFLTEMRKVARESWRVLKPGGKCAILIGDTRKSKHVIPIGFQVIRLFLDAGFVLHELVIKRQHNCKTTGFWYTRSVRHGFLLLAHEYLPVFEKPVGRSVSGLELSETPAIPYRLCWKGAPETSAGTLETTTVWVFPENRLESEVRRNLRRRFGGPGPYLEVEYGREEPSPGVGISTNLLFIPWPPFPMTKCTFWQYCATVMHLARQGLTYLPPGGVLAVEVMDFRDGGDLIPAGLLLYEVLRTQCSWALQEIVIVVPEGGPCARAGDRLEIIHRYLLIYTLKK